MEVIQKTIQQAVTTGITESCTGSCYVIIPDLSVTYHINIALKQETKDWGFIDAYDFSGITGTTIASFAPQTISGQTISRLAELKTFARPTSQWSNYLKSGAPTANGVNELLSTTTKYVYYVDGISYVDYVEEGFTTFSFVKTQTYKDDFINKPLVKDPDKENIVSNPKVNSDVFIVRQQLSAFNDNHKLEFVDNLNQLINYAGGNYFNIVNNV